jgi:hypothetical protein
MKPMCVDKDGVRYNYKRAVLEIMECETCGATYVTHVPTGAGKVMTPEEDTQLCEGCIEICHTLQIVDESGAKPS